MKLLLLREDLADDSESLRPAFSEKNGGTNLEILRSVHESELDESSIARAHEVLVHLEHLGTLTNDTAVDDGLVVWLDGRCVVQDLNLGLEILDGNWVNILVEENHTLSEACPLELVLFLHALNGEADSLSGDSLFYSDHLVVDGLNHHWFEVAVFVRSKVEYRVWNDGS